MAGNQRWQAIPIQLDVLQFEEFVLPHLSVGRRGPAPTLCINSILWLTPWIDRAITWLTKRYANI
jgi:hypothetical protein